MKAYHLEWSYTGSGTSVSGDEYPIEVPVNSYAFIEDSFVLEFDFGQSGEEIRIWPDNRKHVSTIIGSFSEIEGSEIEESTKHYCVECIFEKEIEVKYD